MEIVRAREVDDALVEAVGRLVPQLDPAAPPPPRLWLETLLASGAAELYLAHDESDAVLGMLTLARYPIPTGQRVRIEDVVVDASARGRGVGEALVRAALARARELGARAVELTSRPEREAANRLYVRMGFVRRETNAYRYTL